MGARRGKLAAVGAATAAFALLACSTALAVKDENVLVSFQGTTLLADDFTDADISADGRYVVFEARSVDEGAIFRRDLVTGDLLLVSQDMTGGPADNFAFDPSISADGRYVVFGSRAKDLVLPAPPGLDYAFVRDMVAGTTELVSRHSDSGDTPGAPAQIDRPVISANGRHVLFFSDDDTLYPGGDPDGNTDQPQQVFHRNLDTGETQLVSRDDGDTGAFAPAGAQDDTAISADGRHAVFVANAPGFADAPAGEDGNQVYRRDLVNQTNELVSTSSDEEPIAADWHADATNRAISDDGSRVAFDLYDPEDLLPSRAFVRDLSAGTTHELSAASDGGLPNSYAFGGVISGDGQVALFESAASNLGADDDSEDYDLFTRPVGGGPVTLVSRLSASLGNGPLEAGQSFWDYGLSRTGRYVLFDALDARLIPPGFTMPDDGGEPGALESQFFVRDLVGDPPPPPPGGGDDVIAPVVGSFGLTNKTFRAGGAPTPLVAAKKRRRAPRGTTFRFTLDEPATVRLAISRELKGRRVKGKCRKPSRKNRKRKKCTRPKPAGTLTRAGTANANSVPFSGRIGSRKLRPGKYRVTITATDAVGNVSSKQTRKFKIVR